MIDLGVLTWNQQWEYWIFSRLLRPIDFANVWRWDFLLVPDQVWLLVGAYRAARHLFFTQGSVWTRFVSLGSMVRSDPITFLAFGLLFVAEPIMRRRRALVARAVDNLDAQDLDELVAEEEERIDQRFASEIENAQSQNSTVIPASVLNICRKCRSDRALATNMLSKCGHFPFCDDCLKSENFACNLCALKNLKLDPNPPISMTGPDLAKPPTLIHVSPNVSVNRSCGVCQEREGLLSLMPCGHMLFCGPCVLSFKMRCPFCRERVSRTIRGFDVRHAEIASQKK